MKLADMATVAAVVAAIASSTCSPPPGRTPLPHDYDVEEKSLATLQADLASHLVTSERLVQIYLDRIGALDQTGPALHSVLAVNPRALEDARRSDQERTDGHVRGVLHGLPILLKDNIESADPLPTTAGSLALEKNVTGRDAPVVGRLRDAGAIVLGKTNLSEWADFRGMPATSGWSAVGGLTTNPYGEHRNACGSSSGSGVAVAANLAAAAIGTDTDGSIACPSSVNGIVGLRPTVGLLSRARIVPISPMQDTAGPMTRTVTDAATLLTLMAGRDEDDPATSEADARRVDYTAALAENALSGKRLGLMRVWMGYLPSVDAIFEQRVADLKAAGATIVTIDTVFPLEQILKDEFALMAADFRPALNAYLRTTPQDVPVRTLRDLIAFNVAHRDRELQHFGQELFEEAEKSASREAEFEKLRARLRKTARDEGIDALLKTHSLAALIAPTVGPAWTTDLVNGDHVLGGIQGLHAIAGYPHLTVPMGQIQGLPVGLSLIGPAWSDATLLGMGYAFEQRTLARRPPTFQLDAHP